MLQTVLIASGLFALLVLAYSALSGPAPSKTTQRRLAQVRYRHSANTKDKVEAQLKKAVAARRPKAHRIAGSGSRIEALDLRLQRTGKKWTLSQYLYASLGIGLVVAAIVFLRSGALPLSLAIGALAGFGIPHMVVSRAIEKRAAQFNSKFPDGIELLVRGLRSGLPVTECLKAVGREMPDPVGVEFRRVTDEVKFGAKVNEALWATAHRLDMAEFKFFVVSLSVQQETGGNLAETLANLSDILRRRKQMRLKIKAMSSEAKASAMILGSLPFIMFCIIYLMNPDYESMLFTDPRGRIMLAVGLGAMGSGILVMARMVRFEI